MMKLPRLIANSAIVDKDTGKPGSLFMRYWDTLANAIESLNDILTGGPVPVSGLAVADLPSPPAQPGLIAYASNGRKAGEGPGLGTGVLVFSDAANWIASDTGAPVAA